MPLVFNRILLRGIRFLQGSLINGVFTPGDRVDIQISTSVQSPTPAELVLLDEGKRTKQNSVLITDSELNLASELTMPDWIEINNEWYEVAARSEWSNNILNHNRYIVVKIQNPKDYKKAQL
jgi:hypothetical protein